MRVGCHALYTSAVMLEWYAQPPCSNLFNATRMLFGGLLLSAHTGSI
jgi:hypothetical protein